MMVYFHLLHSHVASVDPHPRAVCVLVAQTDPVAMSVVIIFLCVVVDEFLYLGHTTDDVSDATKQKTQQKLKYCNNKRPHFQT